MSTTTATSSDARRLPGAIRKAIEAAQDKKATDIVVMDLRDVGAFTDYFVICSGQNPRQVNAIAENVEEELRKAHLKPAHSEGYAHAEWILLDYFDFIVHVFNRETRLFYALDRLWGSAPRIVPAEPEGRPAQGPSAP